MTVTQVGCDGGGGGVLVVSRVASWPILPWYKSCCLQTSNVRTTCCFRIALHLEKVINLLERKYFNGLDCWSYNRHSLHENMAMIFQPRIKPGIFGNLVIPVVLWNLEERQNVFVAPTWQKSWQALYIHLSTVKPIVAPKASMSRITVFCQKKSSKLEFSYLCNYQPVLLNMLSKIILGFA